MTPRPGTPLVAMMLGLGLAFGASSATAAEAGHAIAERFAAGAAEEDARRKAEDAKRRAAEEAEMLARARAEALERKAAADKARAEEEAREAAQIAKEKRAEEARRLAEQQRLARERFIAEQIRAEEERQRIAEEERLAEEKRIAEQQERERIAEERRRAEERRMAEAKRAEEERRRAEAARIAEQTRIAEQERRAEEERRLAEERLALAAEHEASHARRAERIRQLEEERNAKSRAAARQAAREAAKTPMGLGGPSHAAPPAAAEAPTRVAAPPVRIAPLAGTGRRAAAAPERVTVLLVMKPGATGIRRMGKKTADPVICSGPTCWIGAGADRAARTVTRGLALGPANTMGKRAAACNRSLTCVFRDVNLRGASASIQPIDLRVLRHDRREPLRLEADRSCRLAGGALVCGRTFVSRSWRAWVIDEDLAREAGPDVLAAALENGLAPGPSAALHVQNF